MVGIIVATHISSISSNNVISINEPIRLKSLISVLYKSYFNNGIKYNTNTSNNIIPNTTIIKAHTLDIQIAYLGTYDTNNESNEIELIIIVITSVVIIIQLNT